MQDILAYLQQDLPLALRFLEQMVNMDSPTLDKALVDRFSRFVGSQFEELGGALSFIPAEQFGDHLVLRYQGDSSDRLLLLGHTDTVFPAGETARRPFRIDKGRAMGPGVLDMKAGILLMWMALRGVRQLRKSVTILLTSDEETGSPSSRGLITAEALRASAVLVAEPSLPGGILKTARKGIGHFTIRAIGRAAHAGVAPESGINAIEEIAEQVLRLRQLAVPAHGTTVTVGVIRGGTRSNVVPAEASAEVDVRVSTSQEAERMTKRILSLQPQVRGAQLEVWGGFDRPPMERTEATGRLFEIACGVAAEFGIELREGSTGGASDGNLTAALGIPTLDGLGAVGDGAHSLDEYVDTVSLPHRAALLAGLLQRL